MALNFNAIRSVVIETVQKAVGSQLSQVFNPVLNETYGNVFNARPNPELIIPDYPYVTIDSITAADTDWFLTNLVYDLSTDRWQYETHKTIEITLGVFGEDAIQIGENLATAYRREDILLILQVGGLALADVQIVQILPELLQTDFLEVSFIQMSLRVNDVFIDPSLESIEAVVATGELTDTNTGVPVEINIDTSPYIFSINTTLPGSDSDSFILPLSEGADYDIVIDWGDGTSDTVTGTPPITHQYPSEGIFQIKVFGQIPELIFDADTATDSLKIISIDQWGGNQWLNVVNMFNFCVNLTALNATDAPNLTAATSLKRMFRACFNLVFNGTLNSWDTSNITNMNTMFSAASLLDEESTEDPVSTLDKLLLNESLTDWDVSNVTDFYAMFAQARLFNGDITGWNIGPAVTTMRLMFYQCDVFDQDISVWDMSGVQRIENMFYTCLVFNQPIGIWDLSSVVDTGNNDYVDSLLELCPLFNQDLSNWPFVQWATFHDALTNSPSFNQDVSTWDLSNMGSGADQGLENTFNGTAMSTANYDLALAAWANETFHSTPSGMSLGMSSTQYSASQQTNRDTLTNTFGWIITDAGSV